MKYILATIITICVMYTGIKTTEKLMKWIDELFDKWEEKKNK